MDYGYKPTTNGRALLAACLAHEKPLQLTRVAFGSGMVEEGTDLAEVHELIHYVAEGAIGERRHENDRLHLTVQYTNGAAHAGVGTFSLSEFIVYALHPDTNEEQDLLYATLGDHRASVPAFTPGYPTGIWNYELLLVVSSEINVSVSAPAGLVTYNDLIKLLNNRAAGAAQMSITIPASGWVADEDTHGAYKIHLDIPSTDITEDMVPFLTVEPESLNTAIACELCPGTRTLPGALRLYANSIPKAAIGASLTLFDTVPQHSGLSSSAATARIDITIPTTNWEPDTDTAGEYAIYTDIYDDKIEDVLVPVLTVYPEHLTAAGDCGLSPYARTIPGALRVYAKSIPTSEISASLALLGVSQPMAGGNGDTVLVPASETNLGGVRVRKGSGLAVDQYGYISIDAATPREVETLYDASKADAGLE